MKHNWEYKPWNDVLKIFNGKNQKAVENPNGPYPIYGSGGIMSYADDYICPENCTIIGRKGNINNPIFVPTKFWNVDTAFGLYPYEVLLPRFLYYFCEIYDFEKHNKVTTIPSLVKNDLLKIRMPVPPMEVQERIVTELDKINEVIADCLELLRTLDALAQSLFYDYFGDPVTNPKGWEVKNLVDICDAISTGITYKPDNVADKGTIVLRSGNIQNSAFVLDDIVRIDMPLKPSQYVKKNDILMCSRNGSARLVGKVALIPELNEDMSWGAFMTIIRSDFYHFLFQYFRLSAFREQLTKIKTTTVNQITIGMLKKIQLPVPPLSLQEKFAGRIEAIEAIKANTKSQIDELQTLLNSRMQYISEVDVLNLKNEIAPLLPKSLENELAKKFDLLSLYVQLGMVDENYDSGRHEGQIAKIAEALRKRATIPDIQAKMPLLNEILTSAFWENKTLASIENMRKEIRDLLKYLIGDGGRTFTVSIEDDITEGGVAGNINTSMTYREKLLDFLTQQRDHPVLRKIHNLEYLTSEDIDELERILWQELGTKEDYERYLSRERMIANVPVAAFIRKVVGLDRRKAILLFSDFISANTLTAEQEEFINNILNYVCQNGDMEKKVFSENRIFRESLLKYFPNKAVQVAQFVAMLHDAITAA